jgi:hypothetical protein
LARPMASGDRPSTSAPCSFSAAARVARPNRVQRSTNHSAPVTRSTSAASHQRSAGTWRPPASTRSVGRGPSRCSDVAAAPSKRRSTTPIRYTISPSPATTRASTGELRSGRKISQ